MAAEAYTYENGFAVSIVRVGNTWCKTHKTGSALSVSHCEGLLSVGTIVCQCQVELGGENQSFVVLLSA